MKSLQMFTSRFHCLHSMKVETVHGIRDENTTRKIARLPQKDILLEEVKDLDILFSYSGKSQGARL